MNRIGWLCHSDDDDDDYILSISSEEARWHSRRALDFESRGPGFDPHRLHRVVSLSKAH